MKDKVLQIRLSDDDVVILETLSALYNKPRAEVIRQLLKVDFATNVKDGHISVVGGYDD